MLKPCTPSQPLPQHSGVLTGVSGLACGLHLQERGIDFRILEATPTVGGRVQTDEVDGFLLDRGFQIFLTSYPEAKAVLDYKALDLHPFYAGALAFPNACTPLCLAERGAWSHGVSSSKQY